MHYAVRNATSTQTIFSVIRSHLWFTDDFFVWTFENCFPSKVKNVTWDEIESSKVRIEVNIRKLAKPTKAQNSSWWPSLLSCHVVWHLEWQPFSKTTQMACMTLVFYIHLIRDLRPKPSTTQFGPIVNLAMHGLNLISHKFQSVTKVKIFTPRYLK